MTVLDTLARQASRLAADVQVSLRRARLEGERRLLQRQHRTALEELGERAYELIRAGRMPEGELAPEMSSVEGKLMEIEAKVTEIEALRADEDQAAADAADRAFPMVGERTGDAGSAGPGAGPGWDAAERFFKR